MMRSGDGWHDPTPGTCTDHLAKVADGTWNRAAIARCSRPWRLRCLLSAGRSAHQMGQRRMDASRGDDEHDLRWVGQRHRESNVGGSTPLNLAEARQSMRQAEPALPRGAAISI